MIEPHAQIHTEEARVKCGTCGAALSVIVPADGPHWLVARHDCPLSGTARASDDWPGLGSLND